MTNLRARPATIVSILALATMGLATAALPASAAEPSVGLGRADTFVVLAGTTVTNTGSSTISGSLGVSPDSAVTGFPPGLVSNGSMHAADAEAAGAQADLVGVYGSAAGRATNFAVSSELAGQRLVGGVYTGGALALNGTVTLDAENVADTVWVFQAASTLITGSNSRVAVVNGANPCNVFWQVGSSATLGTGTTFVGTVMALTSISANTGATVEGRLLARNGAVTLDDNVITSPDCSPVTTTVPTTVAGAVTTTTGATTGSTVPTDETTTTLTSPTTVLATEVTTTTLSPTTTMSPTTTISPTTTVAPASPTTVLAAEVTTTTTRTGPSTIPATQESATTVPGTRTTAPSPTTPATSGTPGPSTTSGLVTTIPRTGGPLNATAAAGMLVLLAGAAILGWSRRHDAADEPQAAWPDESL